MIKAQYSWLKYTLCAILFVLITPIGIAIGTAVGASYQTESKLALGFEGGFDSVLAGMLIYNAIADIILPTFSDEEIPPQWWLQLLGLFGLYVGGTIMGLIGKWA
jgi:zinc transporter 1/2/3